MPSWRRPCASSPRSAGVFPVQLPPNVRRQRGHRDRAAPYGEYVISGTRKMMDFLGIRSAGALLVFGMAVMAYCVNAYSVHRPLCLQDQRPFLIYEFEQSVLRGTAASP